MGEGSAVMPGDGEAEETGEEDQSESDEATGGGMFEEEGMEGAGDGHQGGTGNAPSAMSEQGEFVIASVAGAEVTEEHGEEGGNDADEKAELDDLTTFDRGFSPGPEFEQGDEGEETDGQVQEHHVERAKELFPGERGGHGGSRIHRSPCRAAKHRQQEQGPGPMAKYGVHRGAHSGSRWPPVSTWDCRKLSIGCDGSAVDRNGLRPLVGSMRVLIIGCGYLGMAIGEMLVATGHAVTGVRRGPDADGELAARGIGLLVGDITDRDNVQSWPDGWDVVINAVSSSRGGAEVYRQVYGNGTRHVVERYAGSGLARYIHISSTSVYGQTDGGWVDEDSATEPGTETGGVLVDTEHWLLNGPKSMDWPAVILRVAGIYGPGRGHLLGQLLKDEARIQGDGSRWVNMVHRDDAARGVICVAEAAEVGSVYNVVDDEPVSQGAFLQWLALEYGKPSPPMATESENSARKRGLTHKRVSNRRLRELGWKLEYPTYREGYRR